MASADENTASSDRRGFRRILLPVGKDSALPKPAERSPRVPSPGGKKKGFAFLPFCGLGCAYSSSSSSSSSQAYAPAQRHGKTSGWRARREKQEEEEEERRNGVAADIWRSPGIAAEASVESVVQSHHQMTDRIQGAERILKERPCIERRDSKEERASDFMDSPPTPRSPLFVPDLLSSGHFRHLRAYHRCSMDRFEEVMMTRILLGGVDVDVYDRFKDWRLDVDNMSYEELLELGDRIGYVSTGLREEEIVRGLQKMKHSILGSPRFHFRTEVECKCSICQEEYEVNDEMGRLKCGHSYHIYCIKEWLLQKNACPVCKTAVTKT